MILLKLFTEFFSKYSQKITLEIRIILRTLESKVSKNLRTSSLCQYYLLIIKNYLLITKSVCHDQKHTE